MRGRGQFIMLFVDIWKSIILTAITVISLISNGALIPILLKNREIREDAATPLLVALSISDFIQGATFGMISSILSWSEATKETVSNGLAQFHTFSLLHTRMSSLNLVGSLAVVKMITILKPLRAVDILSKTRIWMILGTCCAVPLTVSLAVFVVPVQYSHLFKDSYFTNGGIMEDILIAEVFISLFVFIISYGVIFVCVVKQYVNMRRLVIPTGENEHQESSPNPIMAAFKSARGIIALCSIYLLLHIIGLFLTKLNAGYTADARFVIYRLYDCNGFINVFTYIAFCKPAKQELKKLFARLIRNESVENYNNTERGANTATRTHD